MGDQIAQQMLAMAEYFRQRHEIRRAIKCSVGATSVAASDCYKILTIHQTGKLYHLYTTDSEKAEKFLDLGYRHMVTDVIVMEGAHHQRMYDLMREYRLEAAIMLAEIYLAEGFPSKVAQLMINLEDSRMMPVLHARLAFLCIEGAVGERKIDVAFRLLDELRYFLENHQEIRPLAVYAMIGKLHVTAHLLSELPMKSVEEIRAAIASLPDDDPSRLNLQVYFDSVHLAFLSDMGMIKQGKSLLKMLQHNAQIHSHNRGIRWADATFITALVCVFTETRELQNCNRDRTTKYYTHARKSIKDYHERSRTLDSGVLHAVRRLTMVADEIMCQSKLINCLLVDAFQIMHTMAAEMNEHPALQVMGVPRVHLLLGMAALYYEEKVTAEKQFKAAIATNMKWDTHLSHILACNLGMLHLQNANIVEWYDLHDEIGPQRLNAGGPVYSRGIVHFVHAFHAFLNNKQNDCKNRVQVIHDLTKEQDMFRLYTMSMLLFTAFKNHSSSNLCETAKPTIDWSTKNGDVAMLVWTYTQLIQQKDFEGLETDEEQTVLFKYFEALQSAQDSMNSNQLLYMLKWYGDSVDTIFEKRLEM